MQPLRTKDNRLVFSDYELDHVEISEVAKWCIQKSKNNRDKEWARQLGLP